MELPTVERAPADTSVNVTARSRWLVPAGITTLLLILTLLWLRAEPWHNRVATTSTRLGALASWTGLAGTVLLSLAIVLSARVRLLETLSGGLDREYRLHHQVGASAFTLIAVHPALLAWRSAPVSWRRAGELWWPAGAGLPLIAGQVALYGMALAMAATLYMHVRYQVLVWLQRLLGAMFVPAAYHVLASDSEVNTAVALRYFLWVVLSAGMAALVFHTVLGRLTSRHYQFHVDSVTTQPAGVTELRLRPDGRGIPFVPGQFAYLRFLHEPIGTEAHPFSMASARSLPELRFAIKDLGDYTHRIGAVSVGAAAVVEGPYGRFSHRFVSRRRQMWIAGGIGIAPFLAMAESLRGTSGYDVDLFYGFPDRSQAPYLDELTDLDADSSTPLRVHAIDQSLEGFLTVDRIREVAGSLDDCEFLLCGPPEMMHALHDELRAAGVPRKRIHFEELAFL